MRLFLSFLFACTAVCAQPTDNPAASHYGSGGYPVWTDEIAWDNVIDMSAYANGSDDFEKFENARDELYAQGGGVLYYPAGTYTFNLPDTGYGAGIGPKSRGLMLKSGVVIRGADLAGGSDQAVVRGSETHTDSAFRNNVTYTLAPTTTFVFPTQMRGKDPVTLVENTAGELPRDWSFIGMMPGDGESTVAEVTNIGVVNVEIEGGHIFWGFHMPRAATMNEGRWINQFKENWPAGAPLADTWGKRVPDGTHYMDGINGAEDWHTVIDAGSGRLVLNCKLNNAAPVNDMYHVDRKSTGSTATEADDFAHYRFSGRISAYGSDIFIANSVIAKPTKNFVHLMKQKTGDEVILFDYANHAGIECNKSAYGARQSNDAVTSPLTGYYFSNVVLRDNWIFSRGNKGSEPSGTWMVVRNTHNERYWAANGFPYDYIVNTNAYPGATPATGINAGGISFDGWRWQSSESASDYMSRGIDVGGNNVWLHRNSVINTGSRGNDGEGFMGQRHNNVETYSWAMTYNNQGNVSKGYSTFGEAGWIGVYDMHAAGLLLFKNSGTGTHGILKAQSNWILDTTVTPNEGTGGTGTPATGHSASAGGDYQAIHTDPVVAPANVNAVFLHGGKGAEITWDDASVNELGFRVDRKIGAGDWEAIAYRPAQSLGAGSGVDDPYNASGNDGFSYPRMNPTKWVDYFVDDSMSVTYRVVAINAADDASTGVSADALVASTAPAPLIPVVDASLSGSILLDFETEVGRFYHVFKTDTVSYDTVNRTLIGTVEGDGTSQQLSYATSGESGFYWIELVD